MFVVVVKWIGDLLRYHRLVEEGERVVGKVDERKVIRFGRRRSGFGRLLVGLQGLEYEVANLIADSWAALGADDHAYFRRLNMTGRENVVCCWLRRGRHGEFGLTKPVKGLDLSEEFCCRGVIECIIVAVGVLTDCRKKVRSTSAQSQKYILDSFMPEGNRISTTGSIDETGEEIAHKGSCHLPTE
jgi:hypothetical protein